MASKFAVLSQEHHDVMKEADAVLEAAITEGRALNDDEQARVAASEARLDELDAVLSVERHQRALRRRDAEATTRQPNLLGAEVRGAAEAVLKARSIAAELLGDPDFAAWRAQMTPNGIPRTGIRMDSPRVPFGALAPLRVGSATSAGALMVPDQYGLVPFLRQPLAIRDLVTGATTESNSVEFVQVTAETNNAAPVAEATDVTAGGVGVKPQSDIAMLRVATSVRTIAHWIAITKQALADAGQLSSYVNDFLLYGLELVLESEMINGDGTGEHLLGILHTPNILTQAYATDIFATTRKAKTQVRLQGRVVPTAYAFNPADTETIDLLRNNEGNYYYGGPTAVMTPRLWGVPIVESEAVPAGTAILGAWNWAVLWDRMQGSLSMSDSHQDFFVKNLIALLAELRAAFGVIRTKAFAQIALS